MARFDKRLWGRMGKCCDGQLGKSFAISMRHVKVLWVGCPWMLGRFFFGTTRFTSLGLNNSPKCLNFASCRNFWGGTVGRGGGTQGQVGRTTDAGGWECLEFGVESRAEF